MVAELVTTGWPEPLGHGAILRGLWSAARAGRLPHALLWRGASGIGKFAAARRFALGLLCERAAADGAPCESCGACKRALVGSHGDLFFVDVRDEPADERSEELRIGRFVPRGEDYWRGASVEEFLGLRASEGGARIVVVREAERANVEAQNALLKMLEEPPERVVWVLETSEPEALLATVHSRCVRVDFASLSTREVEAWLRAERPDEPYAAEYARWSRGSPGRALALAERDGYALRELALTTIDGRTPPLAAARALWELDGEYEGKSPKAQERARLRFALDLWLGCLRDAQVLAAGAAPESLAHADRAASLAEFSGARVGRAITALLDLRAEVELNVDPPALADRALFALAAFRAAPLPGRAQTLG